MSEGGDRFGVGEFEGALDFEEYVSMHRALGNRVRYEILWLLVEDGGMSLEGIEAELAVGDEECVADHVVSLCDVFLVVRWAATERGSTGVSESYRPTVFGRVALSEGIHELVRGEREFVDMYSSDAEDAG